MQPAVPPQGEAKDFTQIATELARRTGLLEAYNSAINRGAAGIRLSGKNYDFSLAPEKVHDVETIWDASCRAASAEITDGAESHGLAWFKEHGLARNRSRGCSGTISDTWSQKDCASNSLTRSGYFASATSSAAGCMNKTCIGGTSNSANTGAAQLEGLQRLWESALAKHYAVRIADYPFWLLTARSMQYSWGGNVGIQLIKEVADNIAGHGNVVINRGAAERLGIADGDRGDAIAAQ